MQKPFFILIILLLGLVSCNAETGTETAARESNLFPLSGTDGETAVNVNLNIDEERTSIAPDGIQVGFTEDGRPYRGNPDAPVLIEEFSDYECPFCARFSTQTMPSLLENEIASGQAVIIFHDFPLRNHPQAIPAANAARCAGAQSAAAYWQMHDLLFENLGDWSNGNSAFLDYGEAIGLEMDAFEECVTGETYIADVLADLEYGTRRGVNSTPSFFINEQPVIGAQPLNVFQQAIAAVASGQPIAQEQPQAAPPAPGVVPTPATIPADNAASSLGDPNAPITIVEYTDYECPFCQRYALQTMPAMLVNLIQTGEVYYMIKDFPLDNIHPAARTAAEAARCAGEQEAYWEMHDAIFQYQGDWAGSGATVATEWMIEMGAELNLDTAALRDCLGSGRYAAAVQENLEEGLRLGVQGTPHFFVAGFPISGAQPYDLFEYAVSLANEGILADAYARPEPEPTPARPTEPVDVPLDDVAYILGNPDAPVTIVEYTDFQCPFCSRHFRETFTQIEANYIESGLVRYVFKDFPLTSIHPQAVQASEAARCAGDQSAYTGMHHLLFERQEEWGNVNSADYFVGYANELGLDTAVFADCLNSKKYETAVYDDLNEGISLGVSGTPAFFINGYFLSGAQPYAAFEQAINSFLDQ